MEPNGAAARQIFAEVTRVRCLECGYVYSKPAKGRTTETNPGCSLCGYVGWVDAAVPVMLGVARRRFAGGPRLRRSVQTH